MAEYYPPVGFHFRVEFPEIQSNDRDILFQSVSGLTATVATESVKEGGENRFEHVLPVRTGFDALVLKRGMLVDSGVLTWVRDAIEGFTFTPTTVLVHLMNEVNGDHAPLVTWKVVHAWPKKWSVGEMNAEQSSVLVETFELTYNFFTVQEQAEGAS
jgi:phage tail-like protein